MADIEIGIDINAKLYLHITGCEVPTAFEVKWIGDVKDGDLGTIVSYIEPRQHLFSNGEVVEYVVEESVEDIQQALDDAKMYRDAAIEKINSMLEK